MAGFFKLYSNLVSSSVWDMDDATRLVWITILLLKGRDQIARASTKGLAHQARVSLKACRKAIAKLSGPDVHDRSGEHEGRRIKKIDEGFLVLNGQKYVDMRDNNPEIRNPYFLQTMPYCEYLETPEWKTLREKKLKEAGFRCQLCNKTGRLNVHHRTYEGRGNEDLRDLIVLCRGCHGKFHDILPEPKVNHGD